MYQQKDAFTMFNSTTNWIEAHHRELKLHLKSSSSFSWNLEKLLIVLDQHAHVVSHKEFINKMYTTASEHIITICKFAASFSSIVQDMQLTRLLKNIRKHHKKVSDC